MRRFLAILTSLMVASAAYAVDWDGDFETEGDSATTVAALPDIDNATREETNNRGETELCWGTFDGNGCATSDETSSGTTDNGRSREGSARVFMSDAAPTVLHALDNKGSAALDQGRLWVDSNSTPVNVLQVYDAALEDVHTRSTAVQQGSFNMVYNGSFEATDGTGEDDSATGTPAGFAQVGSATYTYADTTTPDVRWGDGIYVVVDSVGNGGGMNTVLNNLPTATTYRIVARVAEAASDDICSIATTGALADLATTSSAGTAWGTLTGTFTTHLTVLDDVTITFLGTDSTDVCHWDNISVYQLDTVTANRDEISMPGLVAIFDSDSTANTTNVPTSIAAVPNLAVNFTPPSQGWVVQVGYSVAVGKDATSWDGFAKCNLDLNSSAISSTLSAGGPGDMANTDAVLFNINSSYLNISPAPGTELAYTVECLAPNGGAIPFYNGETTHTGSSNLWLIAHPPR